MRIVLEGERRLRVLAAGGALEVASAEEGLDFSPLHMLAASLATCTLAVLVPWAIEADLPLDDLEVITEWEYVPDPYRVGRYDVAIRWPGLPERRRAAAVRVAQHCTVEHTLTHPPEIEIGVESP